MVHLYKYTIGNMPWKSLAHMNKIPGFGGWKSSSKRLATSIGSYLYYSIPASMRSSTRKQQSCSYLLKSSIGYLTITLEIQTLTSFLYFLEKATMGMDEQMKLSPIGEIILILRLQMCSIKSSNVLIR